MHSIISFICSHRRVQTTKGYTKTYITRHAWKVEKFKSQHQQPGVAQSKKGFSNGLLNFTM